MENIIYVTSNIGKKDSVEYYFKSKNIDIDVIEYDFNEPDINDIEAVSRAKVLEAYNILKSPCFAADSGFYINSYPNNPGYPGAFVKRSGVSKNIDKLLQDMSAVEDRSCYFLDCLTFYDGKNFYTFFGESKGRLSFIKRGANMEKPKSDLWYVFIPEGYDKTLAEMSDEERKKRSDNHISATDNFANWYKDFYLGTQKKLK